MGTENYDLPKIDGSSSVKVPRDFNALADAIDTNLSREIERLDIVTSSLGSGAPKGVYATINALKSAKPTGDANIYVVTADGKWYYWDGTAWTSGGVYQATGIEETMKQEIIDTLIDTAKLIWLPPVTSFSILASSYPNAIAGNAVMTRDTGKVYRFDGLIWIEIQDIDPTAINEVDSRLTAKTNKNSLDIGELSLLGTTPRSLAQSLGEKEFNVKDYGILPSNDAELNSQRIQSLINLIVTLKGGTLFFPAGTYSIDAPLIIDGDRIHFKGCGFQSVLKKTSNTVSNALSRSYVDDTGVTQTINYDDAAIFNVLFPTNSYRLYFSLEAMKFDVGGNYNVAIINAPRLAHSTFKQLLSEGSNYCFKGFIGWMNSFENIRSRYSKKHFIVTGGTSHTFKNVHCDQKSTPDGTGFLLDGLTYSTLESCGVDSISASYVIRNKASITMSGCGAETLSQALLIQNSAVTINGGMYLFALVDSSNGNTLTPWVFESGSNVTLDGTVFKALDYTVGDIGNFSNVSKPVIRGGAMVNMINVDFDVALLPNSSSVPYSVTGLDSFANLLKGSKKTTGWSSGNMTKDENKFKLQGKDKSVSAPINTKTELFRIKNSSYGTSVIGSFEAYAWSNYDNAIGGVLYNRVTFAGVDKTNQSQTITKQQEERTVLTTGQTTFTVAYTIDRDATSKDLIISVTITGPSTYKPFEYDLHISYQGRIGATHSRLDCI